MPASWLELLVIAAGLLPGWIYIHLTDRFVVRRHRSDLTRAVQLVGLSGGASLVSLIVVIEITRRIDFISDRVDLKTLFNGHAQKNFALEPVPTVVWMACVIGGACLIAVIAARLRQGRRDTKEYQSLPIWDTLFFERPDVWVGLTLKSGEEYQGMVAFYTREIDDPSAPRELVLRRPHRVENQEATEVAAEYLVIPDREILVIFVQSYGSTPDLAEIEAGATEQTERSWFHWLPWIKDGEQPDDVKDPSAELAASKPPDDRAPASPKPMRDRNH